MEKITSVLEKYLVPLATKLSNNNYLKAISDGFSTLLPIIMIGAIFTLLASFQFEPYLNLIKSIHLDEILNFAPKVTTDLLALYAVFLIAKSLSTNLGYHQDSTIVAVLALFSFLLLIPLGASGTKGDVTIVVSAAIGTQWLGASGLFSSMILGLLVPTIYVAVIKSNLTIKMPDGVPPTITKSFTALIPGFVIAMIFSLVRYGFALTSYGSFNAFIYTMLQTPLTSLGSSPVTFCIFITMCSLMWFFGLHGGMIVMPLLTMLYQAPALENLEAFGSGIELPNMIIKSSWHTYASLGGAGGTVGLCIALAFFAKSKRYKTLGKLALLPSGLCGINEPIIFGMPLVLNTIMLIPFILTPIATFLIAYSCTVLGLVPALNGVETAMGTPIIFSGWIVGGVRVAILQIVLILFQFICYYPFFRILDKQALNMEQCIDGGTE